MGAFDLTIGPILLGVSLNMYLYGFVTYQYLSYKSVEFNDPIWLRALVAILFGIDTSQTIVEMYAAWYFAVENYTKPSVLGDIIWITPFICVGTALSTVMVQSFLISRLYRLTRQLWLCLFLVVAAVAASLCGLTDCIKAWMLIDITKFFTLIPLTTAWLAIESGVDIIITVVLSRALWRSRTGITRTNTIINRCIRAAIQSGLFPSVFAFLHFIVFFFWPYTYLYAIFHYPLGRIYSNSLIYSLVVRKELANIASAPATTTGSNAFPVVPRATSISIRLHRETVSDVMVVGGDTKTSLNRTTIVSPSQIEG